MKGKRRENGGGISELQPRPGAEAQQDPVLCGKGGLKDRNQTTTEGEEGEVKKTTPERK